MVENDEISDQELQFTQWSVLFDFWIIFEEILEQMIHLDLGNVCYQARRYRKRQRHATR
jgi:hypothetical protein